jgi:allophanate hydrolase
LPAPLSFVKLTLADGRTVNGFLCEHYATLNAIDILNLGGWRHYLKKWHREYERVRSRY